jgi:hypothetical protein|tara:strand:- start:377 stop:541 length:165 start_codon:yes stop_codon:yes gene_type:complete
MKELLKQKIKALEQLNKEASSITEEQLNLNNLKALNNRLDERLQDIINQKQKGA